MDGLGTDACAVQCGAQRLESLGRQSLCFEHRCTCLAPSEEASGRGCAGVASICFATSCSAHLTREIAQFFERFARREATLNLRVVGSIPTRLTIFSSALSDGAK